jgi:hypothetical protein
MKKDVFSLLITLMMLGTLRGSTQNKQNGTSEQQIRVPAYHNGSPQSHLLPVLPPNNFKNNLTRNAYIAAGKIPDVLYQMPCYCYCDRTSGHNSLHDCFTSKHGASCSVCQREALYAYEHHAQGETIMQIRKGIMATNWADLDTSQYEKSVLC